MIRMSYIRIENMYLADKSNSCLWKTGNPIESFFDLPHPFLLSFLLPSRRVVRCYRPHLEEKDPIWGDDWSHSPFIERSPSWGFLGFSSAVRQMPGYMCTAPRIISLSPLSFATDVTDVTLGASGLWLGTRTVAGGTATLTESLFGRSPWFHGQQVNIVDG